MCIDCHPQIFSLGVLDLSLSELPGLLPAPTALSDRRRAYNFGPFITALSWIQVTHALQSMVFMTSLQFASLFPAETTSHSILIFVPCGTGRRYVHVSVRLTWPPSRKPGFAMIASAVDVKVSSMVAAAPPWRLPFALHRNGSTVISHTMNPFSALAETSLSPARMYRESHLSSPSFLARESIRAWARSCADKDRQCSRYASALFATILVDLKILSAYLGQDNSTWKGVGKRGSIHPLMCRGSSAG